jgi:hypothetical protein
VGHTPGFAAGKKSLFSQQIFPHTSGSLSRKGSKNLSGNHFVNYCLHGLDILPGRKYLSVLFPYQL